VNTRLPIEQLREAYLRAILAGELPMAERIIREAIDIGLSEDTIDTGIIAPAMVAIGDQWSTGEIGVADEHLATDISMRMITLQREAFRVARRRATATVLLAAVEGERHVLGLEMAASALLHAGFDVRMLGADVPNDALALAVARTGPSVLGLTASTPETALQAQRAVALARHYEPSLSVVIGGAAAEHARHLGPATAVCTHVGEAVEVVEALAQRAMLN
jgi:methanogenic corrinoid protein MtbC1